MRRGLFLDCDGVIAEIEDEGHRRAFNQVWREEGVEFQWTLSAYRAALAVSGGMERLLTLASSEDFVQRVGPPERFGDWRTTVRRWHSRKTQILSAEVLRSGVTARPGVRRLALDALGAGWQVTVVSSGATATVEAVVTAALGSEIRGQVDLVTGRDVSEKKPDPQCYRVALARSGLEGSEVIAVEDSSNGLKSARAAGIRCVVTTTEATSAQDFTGAAMVLESLGEPPEYLDDPRCEHVRLADLDALLGRPHTTVSGGPRR